MYNVHVYEQFELTNQLTLVSVTLCRSNLIWFTPASSTGGVVKKKRNKNRAGGVKVTCIHTCSTVYYMYTIPMLITTHLHHHTILGMDRFSLETREKKSLLYSLPHTIIILYIIIYMYMYIHVGKVTALGVLCCFALFVCLTLLASFFLPSHLSLKHVYQSSTVKKINFALANNFDYVQN